MPKRVIDFDAMWGSDKLAACAAWAQAEYAWLYGLADASGCFELTNLRVIWGRVAAVRGNFTIERLEQVFAEFQDKGLLFVWEYEGKRYAHWTGSDVPGRLPPPSWSSSSASGGEGVLLTGSVGSIIYNNTVYGPGVTNPVVTQASTSTGALVKNNIFYTGGYASVDATSETSTAYDYNDYFSASGTPFSWGGTAYTFANWQTNSSQDLHSFSADPNLTNASSLSSTGNFALLAVSPAINAGVNLGSTYQMSLSPASSWPGGVSLINQNSAGSGWEIGGYVYPANAAPTLLMRGCCD
jgi:hypothetical protein